MKAAIAIVVIAGALAILRPWTVVPIQTATARTFDAAGYVASIWDPRVLPTAESTAIDIGGQVPFQDGVRSHFGTGPAPKAVFVKGTARITDVDRTSRAGLAHLALPWAKGSQTAAIQIGPVIRGTALRDAVGFIRFTDFMNQLEFAGVANALNDHVVTTVLPAAPGIVPGTEITFVGAVPVSTATTTLEIVPVRLTVAGGTR